MRPAAVTERRAWAVRGGRRSYKGAWLRGGVVTRDVTPLGGMRSAAVSRVAWGCRGGMRGCSAPAPAGPAASGGPRGGIALRGYPAGDMLWVGDPPGDMVLRGYPTGGTLQVGAPLMTWLCVRPHWSHGVAGCPVGVLAWYERPTGGMQCPTGDLAWCGYPTGGMLWVGVP